MARILAIDYGLKRTGLATTDPMQIIATGLTTVPTKELFGFLKKYCSTEDVEAFVIGDSKNLDNTPSEIAADVKKFSIQLKNLFPDKEIFWIDERFTSKMAQQSMIFTGMKKSKRQQKALVDEISATIILQSYLQSKSI
jgi:putative holliday junction resolvase